MGDVQIPPSEIPLNRALIAPQHLNVEISMLARLLPSEEIERPTAADPPEARIIAEKRRSLVGA